MTFVVSFNRISIKMLKRYRRVFLRIGKEPYIHDIFAKIYSLGVDCSASKWRKKVHLHRSEHYSYSYSANLQSSVLDATIYSRYEITRKQGLRNFW